MRKTKHLLEDTLVADDATLGRQQRWVSGNVDQAERQARYHQKPKLILITGTDETKLNDTAARLERGLFEAGRYVHFLGLPNLIRGLGADATFDQLARDEHVRRLGELGRLFADAGCILITAASDLDLADVRLLGLLSRPAETLVITIGEQLCEATAALMLSDQSSVEDSVDRIVALLLEREVILDYQI